MVFRFLDKCVSDLDTPSQVIDHFRLATKIHAIQVSWGECAQTDCDMAVIYYYSQGLGIKDFKIIKGDVSVNFYQKCAYYLLCHRGDSGVFHQRAGPGSDCRGCGGLDQVPGPDDRSGHRHC